MRLSNYSRSLVVSGFKVEKNPCLDKYNELKPIIGKSGLEEVKPTLKARVFEKPIFCKDDFRIEVMRRNGTFDALQKSSGLVGSGTSSEKADVFINQFNNVENG